MCSHIDDSTNLCDSRSEAAPPSADADFRLGRWLVSFASGTKWYSVGEFVALDAAAAIERAVEIFGPASDYRAEEIPWDTAPLPKPCVARSIEH
jgi:hypothetical protein